MAIKNIMIIFSSESGRKSVCEPKSRDVSSVFGNIPQIFEEDFDDSLVSVKHTMPRNLNVDDVSNSDDLNKKDNINYNMLHAGSQCNSSGSENPMFSNKKRNELIGTPSDVALLRYVESIASVEGIRQRFQVNSYIFNNIYQFLSLFFLNNT